MYRASAENFGDSRFYATTRHSSFTMDTEGKGASPVDTLLAAACGCVGHYVRDYLREQGVSCPTFPVTAEATATPDQSKLAGMTMVIDLGSTRLGEEREAAMLRSVEKCKVIGTLRLGCPIEIRLQRPA